MTQPRRQELGLLPCLGLAVRDVGVRRPGLTGALLALVIVIVYRSLIDLVNGDLEYLFLNWVDYIQANGYWAALKDPFHNASGAYIYLLTLATVVFDGFLNDLHIIKMVSILGAIFVAWMVYRFAKSYGDPRIPPIFAAGIFLLIPSVAMNTVAWGQSDIFYTGFLVASLMFALRKKIILMIVCFGIAFSFKLQAVFFGPFVLFMMLRHRTNLAWLVLIPLIYAVVNLGFVIAGRPLESVLLIYPAQFGTLHGLSLHAPNPWWPLEKAIDRLSERLYGDDSLHAVAYAPLTVVGLVLTVFAALRLALLGLRRIRLEEHDLVAVATLILTLMPYLLPKMHDRYFFPATVFSFLLFLVRPSLWPMFLCVEIGSSLAHVLFIAEPGLMVTRIALMIAIGAISLGLFLLLSLVAAIFAPRGTGRWQQFFQAYGALPRASA